MMKRIMTKPEPGTAAARRQLMYGVIAVAVAVAGLFGWIRVEDVDGVTAGLFGLVTALGVGTPAFAATKVNKGSDSTTTLDDVKAAYAEGLADGGGLESVETAPHVVDVTVAGGYDASPNIDDSGNGGYVLP